MSKYAYHTFQLSCRVGFSLVGLVKVSHQLLSVKHRVEIHTLKNTIKNESWRNEHILRKCRSEDKRYRACNRILRCLIGFMKK